MSWLPRPAKGSSYVAPSLLSADFANLGPDIASITAAGARLLHLDIMDGHFVPNITFGPFICSAIRRLSDLPLDAHLMITNPDQFVAAFAKSGVDSLTIHIESDCNIAKTLQKIGDLGLKRGISLNPTTSLKTIMPYLNQLDLVLVMGVQPGFGGQEFNSSAVQKIEELAKIRYDKNYKYLISIDGGVNGQTGPICRAAGADILVSGSWLFGSQDRSERIGILES